MLLRTKEKINAFLRRPSRPVVALVQCRSLSPATRFPSAADPLATRLHATRTHHSSNPARNQCHHLRRLLLPLSSLILAIMTSFPFPSLPLPFPSLPVLPVPAILLVLVSCDQTAEQGSVEWPEASWADRLHGHRLLLLESMNQLKDLSFRGSRCCLRLSPSLSRRITCASASDAFQGLPLALPPT